MTAGSRSINFDILLLHILTDHKPLIYAMHKTGEKYTAMVARHLAYISQFTTDIRHVRGDENQAADALSRGPTAPLPQPDIQVILPPPAVDYAVLAAAQQTDEELKTLLQGPTALNLQSHNIPGSDRKLWCDVSCGPARPVIPEKFRRQVFLHFHNLSHPGANASHDVIRRRVVWKGMAKDIKQCARECIPCQQAKVQRHTRPPLHPIPVPSARFHTVDADIVGPLPEHKGFRYLLTVIDRTTRWATAIPMKEITAEATSEAFLSGWVAIFGASHVLITDQGRQFESYIFKQVLRYLGTTRNRTTAYHPQSNGLCERFHRRLKDALRAAQTTRWVDALPVILLTLRATAREDEKHSPAQVVFGEDLRLPNQFQETPREEPSLSFLPALQQWVTEQVPTPTRQQPTYQTHWPPSLKAAPYLFLRRDAHTSPLECKYSGPYEVLQRDDKHVTLKVNSRPYVAAWARMKEACVAQPRPLQEDGGARGTESQGPPGSSGENYNQPPRRPQFFSDYYPPAAPPPVEAQPSAQSAAPVTQPPSPTPPPPTQSPATSTRPPTPDIDFSVTSSGRIVRKPDRLQVSHVCGGECGKYVDLIVQV